jgi:hypothetical protein
MGEALLEQMLKDYLRDKHPKKYKEMRKSGDLGPYIRSRVNQAEEQQRSLEASGMRDYEAREVVIHDLCQIS